MLNASRFGYDNTTKRITASNDVWSTWIQMKHQEQFGWTYVIFNQC